MWDLMWLAGLGVLPLLAGGLLLRKGRVAEKTGRFTLSLVLSGLIAAGAAIWSAQAPKDRRFTTVAFPPLFSPMQAIGAIQAEGGTLVWSDPAVGAPVIAVPEERRLNFCR